jgi:hypothetical protein
MNFTITREEVEAGHIAGPLARLMVLTDSRASVFLHQGALVLHFEGYEDEARELFEIPGLRAFMQALVREWPHWLWFLKRGSNSIPLLFAFLCRVEVVPGRMGNEARLSDGEEFAQVLEDLLARAWRLYELYGISSSQAAICVESAVWDIFEGSA